MTLRARFGELVRRSDPAAAPDVLFDDLSARYAEPHRAYHTMTHVAACLADLDRVAPHSRDPDVLEWALWYHDAIYDTHARDNEERSAELARDAMERAAIDASRIGATVALILATRNAAVPTDDESRLLVDIDLSILGQDEATFDRYEDEIRFEYAWVPEEAFRSGRAAVLRSFLERPAIFSTEIYRERLESRARANLARSLAKLTG